MPEKTKAVFFGTSSFGIPALEWLSQNAELLAVVTTPDKPAGRRMLLQSSPIKDWAMQNGIKLLQPEKLKPPEFQSELASFGAEVAVLASYGKIVPQEILDIFPKGIVNIHPSLLPKYRGATPVQSAILSGDKNTGVSLMLMDKDLDHGPIISQSEYPISGEDTNESLHDKLAAESVKLLSNNFYKYLAGEIKPVEQNHAEATFTKLLTKDDGKIDWKKPAEEIERQVRALVPWPGTWTETPDGVLKIFSVAITDLKLEPGQVTIGNNKIYIGTGFNALEILVLQIAGGRRVGAEEFLRGYRGKLEIKML